MKKTLLLLLLCVFLPFGETKEIEELPNEVYADDFAKDLKEVLKTLRQKIEDAGIAGTTGETGAVKVTAESGEGLSANIVNSIANLRREIESLKTAGTDNEDVRKNETRSSNNETQITNNRTQINNLNTRVDDNSKQIENISTELGQDITGIESTLGIQLENLESDIVRDLGGLENKVENNENNIDEVNRRIGRNEHSTYMNVLDISNIKGFLDLYSADQKNINDGLNSRLFKVETETNKQKLALFNMYDLMNISDHVETVLCTSSGTYASSLGYGSASSGYCSTAIGLYCTSTGEQSSAFGNGCTASGDYSNAFGGNNTASGNYSNAFGGNDVASGEYANTFGLNNTASGVYSNAFGVNNTASGAGSFAIGNSAEASDVCAVAIGQNATASGNLSCALGYEATASSYSATAIGRAALAKQNYTLAMGNGASCYAVNSAYLSVTSSANATGNTTPYSFIIDGSGVGSDLFARVGIDTVGSNQPAVELHVSDGDLGEDNGENYAGLNGSELYIEDNGDSGITIGTPEGNTGTIHFTDASGNKGSIGYNHAATNKSLDLTSGGYTIKFTTNGYLGINTTPLYNLHVNGTARFEGDTTCGGNLIMKEGKKIYLDGGDNTFIEEAADVITFQTGGQINGRIDGDGIAVQQTDKIILDGTTKDSYITEESLNNVKVYVAGTERGNFTTGGLQVNGGVDTGHGFNELYAMNQDVETADDVTFNSLALTEGCTVGAKLCIGNSSLYEVSSNTLGLYGGSKQGIRIGGTQTIFNYPQNDMNMRFAGDTETALLFTDAHKNQINIYGTNPSYGLDVSTNMRVVDNAIFDSNVGIGTVNPLRRFDVVGAHPQIMLANNETDDTAKYSAIISRQYDSGTESEGFCMLGAYGGSSTNELFLGGYFSEANAVTKIGFYTAANTTTRTGTERMTINSSGNVGIGDTNPSHALDVTGTAHITGKLTLDSGSDPMYTHHTSETRQSIIDRVAIEVPPSKLNGCVQFFNGNTGMMELYMPSTGEFKDYAGNLLEKITPVEPTYEYETKYYYNKFVNKVMPMELEKQDNTWQIKDSYVLNEDTGEFWEVEKSTTTGGVTSWKQVVDKNIAVEKIKEKEPTVIDR